MRAVYKALIISVGLASCTEEVEFRSSNLGTEVITGFQYRDGTGGLRQKVGQPNTKTSSENGLCHLLVYPIPTRDFINITFLGNKADQPVRGWITAATVDNVLYQNVTLGNGAFVVVQGEPLAEIEFRTDRPVTFDLSDLPAGAYRLYAKTGDDLLWENILIEN